MRIPRVLLIILALAIALVGCREASRDPSLASPVSTPTGPDDWVLVQEARAAYRASDFARALELARRAAAANPDNNTAWELYRQASIAQAADEYLRTLPAHRYRLSVEEFIRDRVNHSREWFVVDVREPQEFAAGHIEGAINIPLSELLRHLDELPDGRTAPILLYCHSQRRSTHALVVLHELGYLRVYHLEGGYAAYVDWRTHNPSPTPGPTPTPAPEEPDLGC